VAQADEGESLDVQQRQVSGYATMNGLSVDKVFVERGVSGSKPLAGRPEGSKLLAVLQPSDVVITPKLARMFRSALDALDVLGKLKQNGVALHMIDLGGDTTGNGVSKLVFTILSAVAEAERDRTRERITEVKRDQRQRGRYLGGKLPFGWRVGEEGALVEIPEQQAAIRRMQRMRDQGMPLRTIAEKMNKDGHALSPQGIKKIVAGAERRAGRRNHPAQAGSASAPA
jgi:DNA invertase Pin-like site-specific DNA recombinase